MNVMIMKTATCVITIVITPLEVMFVTVNQAMPQMILAITAQVVVIRVASREFVQFFLFQI